MNLKDKKEDKPHLPEEWKLIPSPPRLRREFSFTNFKEAMNFARLVGLIAEEQNHHPEFFLGWGHCHLEIWTHTHQELTDKDFILARKINQLWEGGTHLIF